MTPCRWVPRASRFWGNYTIVIRNAPAASIRSEGVFCGLPLSPKPSPLGGRWRAAPDEGRTFRSNPLPGNIGTPAPHQSPSVPASPSRGKPFAWGDTFLRPCRVPITATVPVLSPIRKKSTQNLCHLPKMPFRAHETPPTPLTKNYRGGGIMWANKAMLYKLGKECIR